MKRKERKYFSFLIILVLLILSFELFGCLGINAMMFHPQQATYNATNKQYVNIGTNGANIAAIVYEPEEKSNKAIIRCHGNAEDAMQTLWLLSSLTKDGITVASVDYPGYGLSDGSPNEEGCYRVVHRLYDWLVEEKGISPENIIIDGFSIGTGPAVELASTRTARALILEAPYLSAPRIVTKVRLLPIDPFPNLKRIKDVKCPITIIHGTEDSIIPHRHGQALYDLAPEPKQFLSVPNADHNNLMLVYGTNAYLTLIRDLF